MTILLKKKHERISKSNMRHPSQRSQQLIPTVKTGFGSEHSIAVRKYSGQYAYDEWKNDPDAIMFVSGHGIDDEWFHSVCHVDDDYNHRALHSFQYSGNGTRISMVAELYIDEPAKDVHITSALIDFNNTVENRDVSYLQPALSRHAIGLWVISNYLAAFFGGSEWQVLVNQCRVYTPGVTSNWKSKKIGQSTLAKCKDILRGQSPEWGKVYIICNVG